MHSRASLAAVGINSVEVPSLDPKRRVIRSARKDPKASAASSGTVITASPHLATQSSDIATADCVHERANLWRPAQICRACCKSATFLGGLGLLGWRRKRKVQAV